MADLVKSHAVGDFPNGAFAACQQLHGLGQPVFDQVSVRRNPQGFFEAAQAFCLAYVRALR